MISSVTVLVIAIVLTLYTNSQTGQSEPITLLIIYNTIYLLEQY